MYHFLSNIKFNFNSATTIKFNLNVINMIYLTNYYDSLEHSERNLYLRYKRVKIGEMISFSMIRAMISTYIFSKSVKGQTLSNFSYTFE